MGENKALSIKDFLSVDSDGHLTLRGVDLVKLCVEFGTPLFVFDEGVLVENFERFKWAFESLYPKVMVCYSVKTNNNLAVCKILREKGAYAEVSSALDLYVALKAGFTGDRIIYDGPYKPVEALEKAVKEGVLLINCESFAEIERLNAVAGKVGVKQAVGIRVNSFRDPGFSKYFSLVKLVNAAYCNLDSRFGFPLEEAYAAFEKALGFKNLIVEGIMTHPYRDAVKVLLPMMRELREKLGVEIKYLNVGGGFNPGDVRFVGGKELIMDFMKRKVAVKSNLVGEEAVPVESVAKSVVEGVMAGLGDLKKPTLILEPGRFITSSAGILLVRVDHVKRAGGYKWVVVDGGTNLLPNFGAVELRQAVVASKASEEPNDEVNIVGPLLYPGDFIALKASLPRVFEGDIISIFGCGAYTISRANQFLYPRPSCVLLGVNGEVRVIRERENCEDVLFKDKEV